MLNMVTCSVLEAVYSAKPTHRATLQQWNIKVAL